MLPTQCLAVEPSSVDHAIPPPNLPSTLCPMQTKKTRTLHPSFPSQTHAPSRHQRLRTPAPPSKYLQMDHHRIDRPTHLLRNPKPQTYHRPPTHPHRLRNRSPNRRTDHRSTMLSLRCRPGKGVWQRRAVKGRQVWEAVSAIWMMRASRRVH